MALRIASVTIDCADVQRMTDFWSAALGYQTGEERDIEAGDVFDPRDQDVELVFVRVSEAKMVKNRVHLDIGADNREVEVARLEGLGATAVETIRTWTVMRDPEGNEFCVIQVAEGDPLEDWRT